MAISAPTEFFASNMTSQTSTSAVVPTGTIAVGTLLVLIASTATASKTISSVTDTGGNTWTVDHTATGGSNTNISFASTSITTQLTTGSTVTVHWGSATSGTASVWLQGMTGGATSSLFDQSADNNQTVSSQNWSCGPTGTLAQANEIAFCAARNVAGGIAYTANSGWTAVTTVTAGAGGLIYQLPAATTALTGSIHLASSSTGVESVATYKGANASPPANTVAPAVTGTATVGSVLTTTNGTWTDAGGPTFTYAWQRDVAGNGVYSNISSATNSTYTLVSADDTCHVRCVVKDTDANGNTSANSNSTAVVTFPVPVNSVAPAVTGTVHVGSVLTTDNGTWSNSPTSFTYQWQDSANGTTGWANISAQTASTYTIASAEDTKFIRCNVAAINDGGTATAVSSNVVGAVVFGVPVNSVAPVVTGSTPVGSLLTTTNGTWSNTPTSFTYQWTRAGSNISSATSSTYTTVTADGSHSVACNVVAINDGGSSSAATSNAIAVDAPSLSTVIGKTGTSGTAVMQKAGSGWTYITGKTGTSGTAVDQKGAGSYTKIKGH